MSTYTYLAFTLAKKNKKPIPTRGSERRDGSKPGEIISGDPVGKISPASAGGYHYFFFLFKDLATGYLHAILAKTKDEFLTAFRKVHDLCLEMHYSSHRSVVGRGRLEASYTPY
jgi:hypothetical protein